MEIKPTSYKLENCATGRQFQDATGWMLADPEHKDPALVRAVYEKKQIEFKDNSYGIYKFADWMPIQRMLDGSCAPVTYKSEVLAKELELENLYITFSGWWPEKGAQMPTCSFKETEAYSVCARLPKENNRIMVVASAGKHFWWVSKKMVVDRTIFRTNGQSVCLVPEIASTLRQYISKDELKPSSRYKLSFFIKLKGVSGGREAPKAGVTADVRFGCDGKYFVYYPFKQALRGDMDWTRFEFEFDTPQKVGNKVTPYIGFYLNRKATGKVWIDHVEMVEVKKSDIAKR